MKVLCPISGPAKLSLEKSVSRADDHSFPCRPSPFPDTGCDMRLRAAHRELFRRSDQRLAVSLSTMSAANR